jgi:drug/metabolite transporter (DMT)-like permease
VADSSAQPSADRAARLMLVALALTWGLTWPALRIALDEIPPFSMRTGTCGLGMITVFGFALLQHRKLAIAGTVARAHVLVAGCLNLTALSLFTAFAQLATATSRVIILTYTMPIWASLMARPILGEQLTRARVVALVLCGIGLAVLIRPLIGSGDPVGFGFALASAVSWAAGTVYLKWARIKADPIAVTAWQLVVATAASSTGLWLVESEPHLWPVSASALAALIFSGVVGSGVAYLLWFEIVRRLAAITASLAVLSVPVVGIVASILVLGERPTLADCVGFALIFAAAACVLLAPGARASTAAAIEPTPQYRTNRDSVNAES